MKIGVCCNLRRLTRILSDLLKELALEFEFTLAAWVVLDNHYHILTRSHEGAALSRFIGRLHS